MSVKFDHSTFTSYLQGSGKAVAKTAEMLLSKGSAVVIPPTQITPSREQRNDYVDEGDLLIQQRVEVKQRKDIAFTCRNDFPFHTIIIDEVHKFDRAWPKPIYYVIWNKDLTHFAIAMCKHAEKWVKMYRVDSRQDKRCLYYEAYLDDVTFYAAT